MRRYNIAIALTLLLLFEIGSAMATPLEITVSQRYSVRDYTDQPVTSQQLLTLLCTAYGYSGANRVLPKIGDAYSLTLFSINSSGSYIYTPETNSMSVWDTTVTKETISPRLTQTWENGANVVVVIVWNQTKMNNGYFAYAEAGYLVQNFYLAAVNSAIGTCCAQTFDSDGLRTDLKLPSTMIPLLIMPTGLPTSPYPAATPDYSRMTRNLPPVQNSEKSFTDALSAMNYAQTWSTQALSLQEQSQLLWAAYGYSSTGHRTTPSWGAWYPLIVYMSNATGTFRYSPENHSVTEVQAGDKRSIIATACGNQAWAANAPAIFLVAYNSSYNTYYPEPGWYDFSVEVDAGCVAQQILLESSAISLSASIVAKGFESWNGTTAQTLRNTLDIASSIVPLYIVPVGHAVPTPTPTPTPSSTPSPSPTPTSSPSPSPSPSTSPFPSSSPTTSPSSSPSPTPTSTPAIPEPPIVLVIAVPALIAFVILSLFLLKRKIKVKTTAHT
jgi:hypothetical protein